MVLETIFALASLPLSIATVEGIRHQRETNASRRSEKVKDAVEQRRLQDFKLEVYCDAASRKRDQVHGKRVVLSNGKLYLESVDASEHPSEASKAVIAPTAKISVPGRSPPASSHPFTGFFLDFQPSTPSTRCSSPSSGPVQFSRLHRPLPFRGLVSTTSYSVPAPLNWIYIDRASLALRYGPRSVAAGQILGPWDWTEDESGVMVEGWEGFVAVEEADGIWSLAYDAEDDGLQSVYGGKRRVLRVSLERRVLEVGEDL